MAFGKQASTKPKKVGGLHILGLGIDIETRTRQLRMRTYFHILNWIPEVVIFYLGSGAVCRRAGLLWIWWPRMVAKACPRCTPFGLTGISDVEGI